MGDKINLTLAVRDQQGKKVAGLRREGFVPGVVYGHGFDPILVKTDYSSMEKVVREAGKHTPVHITVDGKKKITLIKDIARDPVRSRILNVSFHAVKANEVVHAEVPIHLIGEGESPAEKAGLIVLQAIETVEIKAKPGDLPEALEISIASLATDEDKLTLGDITLPEGVEYADVDQDLELVVANVYEPAALEAANEAAAGDATIDTEVEAENGEADEAPANEEEKKAE
ncbi:MAG: 50S ribosomal protein L25 [Candidatus Saccharimonadota bacterium]|jgi:large subunit ribosomal protein L25